MKYNNQDVQSVTVAPDQFQHGAVGDARIVFIEYVSPNILPMARTITQLKQQSASYAAQVAQAEDGKNQVDSILEVTNTL